MTMMNNTSTINMNTLPAPPSTGWIRIAKRGHLELYAEFKTAHPETIIHFKNGRLYTIMPQCADAISASPRWCIVNRHSSSMYGDIVPISEGHDIHDICVYTSLGPSSFSFGIYQSTRQGRLVRLELHVNVIQDDTMMHCIFCIPLQQRPVPRPVPQVTISARANMPDPGTIMALDDGFWSFYAKANHIDSHVDRGMCSIVVDGALVDDHQHASHWFADGYGNLVIFLDQPQRWNGSPGLRHHLSLFLTGGTCPVRYTLEYSIHVLEYDNTPSLKT